MLALRVPLNNSIVPLRVLKHSAARRGSQLMALVLNKSCNEVDECFRARPLGLFDCPDLSVVPF